MGGSLTCHILESKNLNPTFCPNCVCCVRRPETSGVLWASSAGPADQFVLLSTPFIELKQFLPVSDLATTTSLLFYRDAEGELRVLHFHQPHDAAWRIGLAPDEACEVQTGQKAVDVFPPHLRLPMEQFMLETLTGRYYQLHALFNNANKMIRTMPISDYTGKVQAGLILVGPFSPSYDKELHQYVLNSSPPSQAMLADAAEAHPTWSPGDHDLARRHRRRQKVISEPPPH